jgi:UDP-glucose 4-epimerase
MRVLVTGSSGFVGRHLVASLVQAGMRVRAATRQPGSLPGVSGVEAVRVADLAGPVDWETALDGVDAIVHLAGIAHVGGSLGAEAYARINRRATGELAEACMRRGVRRFVFMSSIRAQSGAWAPEVLTEADAARPTEDYGRSKLGAENDLRASALAWTILRPTAIYGAGVKGNFATLLRLARLPLPLPFGAFSARRSLLGLDNLARAVRFVLEDGATIRQTYIVADPEPVGLAEMRAAMRAGLGRGPGLIALPPSGIKTLLHFAGRDDLWERLGGELVADPRKLIAAGWQPDRDTLGALGRMAAVST